MDTQDSSLADYEAVAEISGRMLGAAQQNDWDRFIAEERRCREAIALLQAQAQTALSAGGRARKHALLRRMLANDAEIRNLAEPRMRQLQDLLYASGNARRLDDCYGSQP